MNQVRGQTPRSLANRAEDPILLLLYTCLYVCNLLQQLDMIANVIALSEAKYFG